MNLIYQGLNAHGRPHWLDKDHNILMEKERMIQYRQLVEDSERSIGRHLKLDEARTMHWLAGWEQGTVNRILGIINEAHHYGLSARV